jgi:hypothetical protein
MFLPQNIKGQEIESNVDEGNLLRGIDNWSSAAWFVSSLPYTFSLFQLETKTTFYKQCWPCMVFIQKIFFGKHLFKKPAIFIHFVML